MNWSEVNFGEMPLGVPGVYKTSPPIFRRAGRFFYSASRRLLSRRRVIGPSSVARKARARSHARNGEVHSVGGADQIFFSSLS